MDSEVFIDIVWRFEEIIMKRDHLRSQIGPCGEGCADEDIGICPECSEIFEKVIDEDKILDANKEFSEVLKKLKKACDGDRTGEYQRILNQPRDGKVSH